MDFKIDNFGEMSFDNIMVEYSDEYISQLVRNRLVSISSDWYYDNIGANLEEMFGEFVIRNKTDVKLKEKIINALCVDELFNDSNLYVDVLYDGDLTYKIVVYVKSIEHQNTSINVEITLDLFNGRLGT